MFENLEIPQFSDLILKFLFMILEHNKVGHFEEKLRDRFQNGNEMHMPSRDKCILQMHFGAFLATSGTKNI